LLLPEKNAGNIVVKTKCADFLSALRSLWPLLYSVAMIPAWGSPKKTDSSNKLFV